MTNKQSHLDGTLSDEEIKWLVRRAKGGFESPQQLQPTSLNTDAVGMGKWVYGATINCLA